MASAAVSAMRLGGGSRPNRVVRGALLALSATGLVACAGGPRPGQSAAGGAPTSRYVGYRVGKPYQINGVWYYPKDQPHYDEIGIASWYGEQFHNHYTADGEVFDMRLPSAAHTTLPLPSLVEVTNLANGRTLVVRVNDRGPFVGGRVIDLSREAAEQLGFVAAGLTRVRVRYVGQAESPPSEPRQYQASNPSRPTPRAASPVSRRGAAPVQFASAAPTVAAVQPVAQSSLETPPLKPPSDRAPSRAALPDVDSLLADTAPAPAPVAVPGVADGS